MNLRGRTLTTLMALALVALIAVSGVGAQAKKQITFASRDFVETAIIAEIVKRLVEEKTDIEVRHLPNIEFRVTVAAMQTGDIDAYSSYSGSQFTTVLGQEVTEEWRDPKKVLEYCKVEMDRRFNMKLFDPLGFDNTYAIAVRRDFAEKHNLEKVSDLVPLAPNLTIATDADFLHREEVMSFTNFTRTYGLKFKKAVAMTCGLIQGCLRGRCRRDHGLFVRRAHRCNGPQAPRRRSAVLPAVRRHPHRAQRDLAMLSSSRC